MKHAIIVLAKGFEEIEAVTSIDLLRRAAIHVCIAGVKPDNGCVTGSHGIRICVDRDMADVTETFDAAIFPGGLPGADYLAQSNDVRRLIQRMHAEKKVIAAICAAPAVLLAPLGILEGKTATCYPGMENAFPKNAHYSTQPVLIDNTLITSRGPGTAIAFALAIIEHLTNPKTAAGLRSTILAS